MYEDIMFWVGIAVFAIPVIGAVMFFGDLTGLFTQALTSGVKIELMRLVGMRLRKVDPHEIVHAKIQLHKAGLDVSLNQLETHYLAAGREKNCVSNVVNAMIAADRSNQKLTWDQAAAIDLTGQDVFKLVQSKTLPQTNTNQFKATATHAIEPSNLNDVTIRIDDTGIAVENIFPDGRAFINDTLLYVKCNEGYIQAGQKIIVTDASPDTVIVKGL